MKDEKFPHTRKPLHWWRWGGWRGKASESWRRAQQQGCRGQSRKIPAQKIAADQPERLVCSTAMMGGGWELRLGLWSSDPRERTGVGCVNTA